MIRGVICDPQRPTGKAIQAAAKAFSDRPIGTSADGVKRWLKEMAAHLGYDRVQWDAIETG